MGVIVILPPTIEFDLFCSSFHDILIQSHFLSFLYLWKNAGRLRERARLTSRKNPIKRININDRLKDSCTCTGRKYLPRNKLKSLKELETFTW